MLGARRVLNSIADTKLIIMSRSVDDGVADKIDLGARNNNIPIIRFEGTSVSLGKTCGLQFRTSVMAFTSLAETNINTIISDAKLGVHRK